VQANVETLKGAGWNFLEPGDGTVACGHTGRGRMREPDEIHAEIDRLLAAGA
jgi:phosphopantothenoylcysteine decarboxylase/phosphopantothenate--cysteine ligase